MFHPVYSKEDLEAVKVVRRPLITRSDKIAGKLVKWLRFVFSSALPSLLLLLTLWLSRRAGFDIVSRYKHRELPANPERYSVESLRRMGCIMSPDQWLMRILFLEVIAGIPVRSLLALSFCSIDPWLTSVRYVWCRAWSLVLSDSSSPTHTGLKQRLS